MTERQIKRLFIDTHYKNIIEYRKARKNDYLKEQFRFTCFIDALCKNGEITQKQFDTIIF